MTPGFFFFILRIHDPHIQSHFIPREQYVRIKHMRLDIRGLSSQLSNEKTSWFHWWRTSPCLREAETYRVRTLYSKAARSSGDRHGRVRCGVGTTPPKVAYPGFPRIFKAGQLRRQISTCPKASWRSPYVKSYAVHISRLSLKVTGINRSHGPRDASIDPLAHGKWIIDGAQQVVVSIGVDSRGKSSGPLSLLSVLFFVDFDLFFVIFIFLVL